MYDTQSTSKELARRREELEAENARFSALNVGLLKERATEAGIGDLMSPLDIFRASNRALLEHKELEGKAREQLKRPHQRSTDSLVLSKLTQAVERAHSPAGKQRSPKRHKPSGDDLVSVKRTNSPSSNSGESTDSALGQSAPESDTNSRPSQATTPSR